MRKFYLLILVAFLSAFSLAAQQPKFPLLPVPIDQWKATDGWQKAGVISVNPFTTDISLTKGKEIYVGEGTGGTIQTKNSYADSQLSFEVLLSPKAKGVFYVLGKYGIVLSGEKNKMGGILKQDGSAIMPLLNTERAAGLWQQVEVAVRAAEGIPNTTIIEYVKINGFTVHLNVFVNTASPNAFSESSMAFRSTEGIMAVRDFKILSYVDKRPITIKNIDYQYFKEFDWETQAINPGVKPTLEGSSKTLSYNVGQGRVRDNNLTNFDITLDVAADGNYAFMYDFAGTGTLTLDGKTLLPKTDFQFREPNVVYATLKKGEHRLQLQYIKVWWPAQMGLFVAGDGIRPYALHAINSLPEKKPVGEIAVSPKSENDVVRSFFMHGNEKRTHVVSVGSPKGFHYAFDLNQGTILASWKGEFADVTEMWYERGEPQILKPKGLTVYLAGKPLIALKTQKDRLPNEYNSEADINYKSTKFDENEQPTFFYDFKNQRLSQTIVPTSDGLKNSLRLEGETTDFVFRIAKGKNVEKMNSYTYRIDDYYVKLDSGVGVEIIENKGMKSLVVDAQPTFSYTIIW